MRAKHTSLTFAVLAILAATASADKQPAADKQPVPSKPAPPPTPPPAPKPPPPPAPALPAPSAALDAHVKTMKKAWKCKGTVFMPDGTSSNIEGTLTVKHDLDKFWGHVSFVGKGKAPYKFEGWRTVDATSGKWHLVLIDNLGGQEIGTSTGPDAGKLTWLTEARGPRGVYKARHSEQLAGKELKMWGEVSTDGKSWIKSYETGCK